MTMEVGRAYISQYLQKGYTSLIGLCHANHMLVMSRLYVAVSVLTLIAMNREA